MRLSVVFAFVFAFSCASASVAQAVVTVGSKKFTESVILGEIVSHLVASAGHRPVHRAELGGTRVLWAALLRGDIDVYPEYTGTLCNEIFAGQTLRDESELRRELAARGLELSRPIGFNNTYALGLTKATAARLGAEKISDLVGLDVSFGFTNEFMSRADGWPGLSARYGFDPASARGLDHDIAYRALESGGVDVIDVYLTDAEIAKYDLAVLEDDRGYFPRYDAVLVYRADLEQRAPGCQDALERLGGSIDAGRMVRMNADSKIERRPERLIAREFVANEFGVSVDLETEGMFARVMRHTWEHVLLVVISLLGSILIAVPLGVFATRSANAGRITLAVVGTVQTIPSLALLVMMIPLLGIGPAPAIVAMLLYSLLPIVRNTYTGITTIPQPVRESAAALGLRSTALLRVVELPMASQQILAGIKTAAVINVGTATLGALVGAGGYGQLILTGIRLADNGLILLGAVPAALLAIAVQELFELSERFLVPRGLRLQAADERASGPCN